MPTVYLLCARPLLDAENILMMKINTVSDIIDIHKLKGEKDK